MTPAIDPTKYNFFQQNPHIPREKALSHTPTIRAITEVNRRKWHVTQQYEKLVLQLQEMNSKAAATLNIETFEAMEWATARARREFEKKRDGFLKELEVEEERLWDLLGALLEWDEVVEEVGGGMEV